MRKMLALVLGLLLIAGLVGPAAAQSGTEASGVVTDQMGRAIAGADVEVYRLGAGMVTQLVTDESGAFRVNLGTESATLWQLRVSKVGYRVLETGWIDLSVRRYQALKLEPLLGDLQVAVRSSTGAPLDGTAQVVGPAGQVIGHYSVTAGTLRRTGLFSGKYRVLVTVPGYVPEAVDVAVSPERTAGTVITLQKRGLVLSGEVKDGVTKLSLAGATVEAIRDDGVPAGATQSDAEGRFRLPLPQATGGSYQLRVSATGYRPVLTQPVSAETGTERDFSGAEAIGLQPITGAVIGTLYGPYGGYLSDATLVLQLKGVGDVAWAKSDSHGNFRFDDVAMGPGAQYRVAYEERSGKAYSEWDEWKPGAPTQVVLQVVNTAAEEFAAGKVFGVVTTPTGAPVQGATVELDSRGFWATAQTAADGTFTLDDVWTTALQGEMGPYSLRVRKEGFIQTREFTLDGKPAEQLNVAPFSRISLRVILSPSVADLSGRVTDLDGNPVASAQVRLEASGRADAWTTTTDAFGWYQLKEVPVLPAGEYAVRAQAAGFFDSGAVDVTTAVKGGEGLPTLRLTPVSAAFTGLVAAADGRPVPGVTVKLRDPDGKVAAEAETDAGGVYRITARVPAAGLMSLTASLDGWTSALAEIATPPAAGTTLSRDLIIFPNTGALAGRTLDEESRPRAGVTVQLVEEGRGVVAQRITDATGRFSFEDVPLDGTGWFWLRARAGSGAFVRSLSHQTELVPLLKLMPGETVMTDLLVK